MPAGGLQKSILHPKTKLQSWYIAIAGENVDDEIVHQCQLRQIAEAIQYTHCTAVENLLDDIANKDITDKWLEFPVVDRHPVHETSHNTLSPILENGATISVTNNVIDDIVQKQLYLNSKDF